MSDNQTGWAELLLAPLGPEPTVETPLAALPCAFPLPRRDLPAVVDRWAGWEW